MTTVDILEVYDPVTRTTQYTASCLTPVDPETEPTHARISSSPLSTLEGAIESLRKRYAEYMGRDKRRVRRSTVEVEF